MDCTVRPAILRAQLITVALCFAAIYGCGGKASKTTPAENGDSVPSEPLRVLVVDDDDLAQQIERQWRAHGSGEVTIRKASEEDVISTNEKLSADVIVYPAGMLGELVEKQLLLPVPNHVLDHAGVDHRGILPLDRGPNVSWGETVYAFSFGSPQLVLFYREDLLRHLGASTPRTWAEYQELLKRLSQRDELGDLAPPADASWSGTAEPLATGWAGQMLLARAAAYTRRHGRFSALFKYKTMEPTIDQVPFVRALDELLAAAQHGPDNQTDMDPQDARQAVLQGRCAMALSWPSHNLAEEKATEGGRLAVSTADLPGSTEVYDFNDRVFTRRRVGESPLVPLLGIAGRLGSVTRESRQSRAALSMLATLTGKELSGTVAPHSRHTTMFRSNHLAKPEDWVDPAIDAKSARKYAELVREHHECSLWLYSVRIPGQRQYLAALDDAVHQALTGEKTSTEALGNAAERWREITKALGVEAQREAYARSLGLKR